MKNVRPFNGIISEQASDQAERSSASHNPELKCGTGEERSDEQRGGLFPRDSTPRSRVALPRECNIATEQFHKNHAAGQLNLFHTNTVEPGGVMAEKVSRARQIRTLVA